MILQNYLQRIKYFSQLFELINSNLQQLQESFNNYSQRYFNTIVENQKESLSNLFDNDFQENIAILLSDINHLAAKKNDKKYLMINKDVGYRQKINHESIANFFDWSSSINVIRQSIEQYINSICVQEIMNQGHFQMKQQYLSSINLYPQYESFNQQIVSENIGSADETQCEKSLANQERQELVINNNLIPAIDGQISNVQIKNLKIVDEIIFQQQFKEASAIQMTSSSGRLIQKIIQQQPIHFLEYYEEIQKKQERCSQHQHEVWYYCITQQNKPLCNDCVANDLHYNHKIICAEHKQQIKYKISQEQYRNIKRETNTLYNQNSQEQKQLFICQTCRQSYNFKNIYPISMCHYKIFRINVQQKSVKDNTFFVCPQCSSQDIHTVLFNNQQLLDHFSMKEQNLNIGIYEQQYIFIKQKLKMPFINKIISNYLQKAWTIFCNLQSFAVHSNTQVQKWINMFLSSRNKKDLFVLLKANQLRRMNMTEEKRYLFLQVIADFIDKQLQGFYKYLHEFLQNFIKKLQKYFEIGEQLLDDKLNKKYSSIINIQNQFFFQYRPSNLYQIQKNHLNRVQKIYIEKGCQNVQDQIAEENRKKSKFMFYSYYLWGKLSTYWIQPQLKQKIYDFFIQKQSINMDLLGELQQYEHIIQQLREQYQKIERQYEYQSKLFKPLSYILQNQFHNLKFINILYTLEQSWNQCKYQVSAFQVFRVIYLNKNLQQFTIEGVQVIEFDLFIKYFRAINIGVQLGQSKSIFDINSKQQLLYAGTRWQKQCRWLRYFIPNQNLKLSLHADLSYFMEKSILQNLIQDLQFFLKGIPNISNLNFTIDMNWYSKDKYLQALLNLVMKLPSIRINVSNYTIMQFDQNDAFAYLLRRLSEFTTITEIQFNKIKFDQNLTKNEKKYIYFQLDKIFKDNNILKLKLCKCQLFPRFSIRNILKSIIVNETTFLSKKTQNNNLFLLNGKSFVKSLTYLNENNKLKNSYSLALNQLSTIYIDNVQLIKDICLHSNAANLRHIYIWNQAQTIELDALQLIFPKLTSLISLYLNDIRFDYKLLPSIFSMQLAELSFRRCKQIKQFDVCMIDKRWPYLKKLVIVQCVERERREQKPQKKGQQEKFNLLKSCQFKGLIELKIDKDIKKSCKKDLKRFKKNGIKIVIA